LRGQQLVQPCLDQLRFRACHAVSQMHRLAASVA
jgi:hypothetical protein